jgi:hypothetical protein
MYIVPRRIREVRQKKFTYRGEIDENGLFDGLGEIHFKDWKYEGEFSHGKISGEGVMEYHPNDIKIEGIFKNFMLNGVYEMSFDNNILSEGFINGNKVIKSENDKYEGIENILYLDFCKVGYKVIYKKDTGRLKKIEIKKVPL